jgi:N-acetylglucosamine kinase-like BadF-type ATPase
MDAIAAVIAEAGARTSPPFAEVGCLCLAGLDFPSDEEKLSTALTARDWVSRVVLHNDTLAVTRAGLRAPWGVGIVCGTGLNCAAIGPDGQTVRFPSLGELSGDFCAGGAWLGVRALGIALRANDGRGPKSLLVDRVAGHFGYDRPEAVLSAVYEGALPYHRLFELAEVLLDAAAEDPPAREAADQLADEVVAMARAAITRVHAQALAVEVVLGGGIFSTSDDGFHRRVEDGLRRAAPASVITRLEAPPVLGAALFGLGALGAGSDALAAARAGLAGD